MRLYTQVGGGLGDVFNKIYGADQFHVLPYALNKDCKIDILTTCCNPAIKDILPNLQDTSGNNIFYDIVYRNIFHEAVYPEDYKTFIQRKKDDGYIFIDGEWDILFDLAPNADRTVIYDYNYGMCYAERKIFNEILENRYIVIHPNGGLQNVDGITRDNYHDLILMLLDKFPSYHFVVIGSSHTRDWVGMVDGYGEVRLTELSIPIKHPRFLDMTNKATGCLSANIVKNARAMIGCHSCWVNMFWRFKKPTITIIPNQSLWGSGEDYIKNNGCNWGFSLPHNKCVIAVSPNQVYSDVIDALNEFIGVTT